MQENDSYLQEKARRTIFYVLIGLFVGGLLIGMLARLSRELMMEIAQKRSTISSEGTRADSFNIMRAQYYKLSPYKPYIQKLLPSLDGVAEVVTKLEDEGKKLSLDVDTKIGDKNEEGAFPFISLTLTFKTTFDGAGKYLAALKKLPFMLDVKAIDFDGPIDSEGVVTVDLAVFIQ